MTIIQVQNLYKIFGINPDRVFPLLERGLSKEEILKKTGCTVGINNASFEIEKGEVFVVMGLSGSGKSTVIRCLNRLIEPTKGKVLLNGDDIMTMGKEELMNARRTQLSMVFQHFGLLPHRTVLANTEYGLEISGIPKSERSEKAVRALELVGLAGYEASYPSQLSGGMKQRVGLARALANDPEVLLMDEAFSALDPLIRNNMQDELLELQARMHKTIVFITHDLDEALKIGDRIAIMKDGAVVQIGTPEEILTQPANDYVRAFVQNVDKTRVITASSIMRKPETIIYPKDGPRMAARKMQQGGHSSIFVVDSDRKLWGLLTIDDALDLEKKNERDIRPKLITDLYVASPDTPISDLFLTAVQAKYPIVVRDENGTLRGILDRATVLREVAETTETENAPVEYASTEEFQNFHSENGGEE
jgi:glycine betaine/proline transport system ATP-binding protein